MFACWTLLLLLLLSSGEAGTAATLRQLRADAVVLHARGELAAALSRYDAALVLRPHCAATHSNACRAREQLARQHEAPPAVTGAALASAGGLRAAAIAHCARAIRIDAVSALKEQPS